MFTYSGYVKKTVHLKIKKYLRALKIALSLEMNIEINTKKSSFVKMNLAWISKRQTNVKLKFFTKESFGRF